MRINCEATGAYYPGMQRFNLLSDPVMRKCFLAIAGFGVGTFALRLIYYPYTQFETLTGVLLFLLPVMILMGGGASRRGWILYAGFCLCSLLGFNLVEILDASWPLAFMVPAFGFLYGVFRSEPDLAQALGFNDKVSLRREIATTVVFSALICVTYYYGGLVAGIGFRLPAAEKFALFVLQGFVQYLAFTGIAYGILSRRLARLRIQNMIVMGICIILIQLYWLSGLLITGIPLPIVFLGNFVGAMFVQMTILFAFFMCRSTRMVLIIHVAFFVMDCLKYSLG